MKKVLIVAIMIALSACAKKETTEESFVDSLTLDTTIVDTTVVDSIK